MLSLSVRFSRFMRDVNSILCRALLFGSNTMLGVRFSLESVQPAGLYN